MRSNVRRRLLASTIICGLAAVSAPAFAQEAQDPAAQKVAEDDASVSELVVVGSRIRRDTFNSPSPITVITRDDVTAAGFNSTTEALQSVGITGGSDQVNNAFGGYVTDGGPGANTVSLRGLGETRTLVLINGRRVAPSGTRGAVGSADLNVLPTAMIERVEILRDGASSIYGSDAIAGVINLITRQNVQGVTLEGQYNRPQENGGEQFRASVVAGTSGDNWTISGSAEYYERTSLTLGDRDFTRCQIAGFRSNDYIDPLTGQSKCYPTGNTGEGGVTINTLGITSATGGTTLGVAAPGATGTLFNRFRPNSTITTGVPGFEGVGGGQTLSLNVRDTFEPRMLNRDLISPVKTYTGYLQGTYDLQVLGNAQAYFEVLGTRRESQQTGYRQLSLDYRRNSPLIPEYLRFSNFSPDQGTSGGERVGVRAFIGFGNDASSQSVDFFKGTVGFRGDFAPVAFFSDWRYDVTFTQSDSDATYRQQSFLTDKLRNSTDAVVAPGGVDASLIRGGLTCRINITDPNERCIVAPALTAQVIGGILPDDYKNYIFREIEGRTKYRESVLSATIDGPLYELPAGQIQAVIGTEFRWQKINDQPDPNSVAGNLNGLTSAAPTVGDDSVKELFAEIEVPILRDMSFVKDLTLNGSARYTDYESYGSDWTYKISGIYAPTEWLSLRAAYGTSFRAPALYEQFQGGTSGFLASTGDPCNNYGGNQNPARVANCASELPGNPTFTATTGIRVITAGGAEQGLFAETSKNLTVGAIFEPPLPDQFGDFSFAIDYFDIEINDGVSRIGASAILSRCYNDPGFRSAGGFCRLIAPRDPASNQLTVFDSYTNVATSLLKGIDYTFRYSKEFGPGTLILDAALTQIHRSSEKLFDDDELVDAAGTLPGYDSAAIPEWSGTFNATYRWDKWRVRYGLEWTGETDSYGYFEEDPETSQFNLDTPDYVLHNISVRYTDDDLGFGATVGVRNFTDQDPPSVSSGVVNRVGNAALFSGYDYVGRTFFVNLTKSF